VTVRLPLDCRLRANGIEVAKHTGWVQRNEVGAMASLSHPARGAASAEETPPNWPQAREIGDVAPDLVRDITHQFRGLPR
jgi:hypothetical protein